MYDGESMDILAGLSFNPQAGCVEGIIFQTKHFGAPMETVSDKECAAIEANPPKSNGNGESIVYAYDHFENGKRVWCALMICGETPFRMPVRQFGFGFIP